MREPTTAETSAKPNEIGKKEARPPFSIPEVRRMAKPVPGRKKQKAAGPNWARPLFTVFKPIGPPLYQGTIPERSPEYGKTKEIRLPPVFMKRKPQNLPYLCLVYEATGCVIKE